MLTTEQIDRIGQDVAVAHLPAGVVKNVSSRPDVDWDGDAIIRVLFVLTDKGVDDITGGQAIKALSALLDRLEAAGETRRGTIDYATEAELAAEQAAYGST
jgi:hypothetical protein